MKKILFLLSLCVGLSTAATAATATAVTGATGATGADRDWVDYKHLLEITRLDKFYAAPVALRDKVRMYGTVKPNNAGIAPAGIVFTVVHGAERKRISVSADGTFDPAIDPAWAKDNPKVLTNMPEGEKAGFSFGAAPLVPAGLQFDYQSLMGSVPQGNALIKAQAGIMRFMMPTFVGLALHYPRGEAATAHIQSRQGEKTISADANGVLRLMFEESLLAANAQVTLSQRPQSFDLIAD
ncbi:MAG: DUF2987 domain-containing protein [Burkholderiales bacterium]|nr:DUF2987 domain-containing protein [Burkholderiales bacterium]